MQWHTTMACILQVSGEKVDVTVQLVKPDYLVVSLPRRKPANPPTLGFLSTKVRSDRALLLYGLRPLRALFPVLARSRVMDVLCSA
jgi:hypothetical protein